MTRVLSALFPLLALSACDSDVTRRPSESAGGAGGADDALPTAVIEIVDQRGEPSPPVDVLVHDPSGALRSRYASQGGELEVQAEDDDFVSVIWQDSSQKWRMDTAVVTAEARRLRFYRRAELPTTSANAPVQLDVSQSSAPGADQYFVGASCGPSSAGWTDQPASVVAEGYRGCVGSPTSAVIAMSRGTDKRLVTFDYVEVNHQQPADVNAVLPSTPVQRTSFAVTASWPAAVSVGQIGGTIDWRYLDHVYLEDATNSLPLYEPVSPTVIAFAPPALSLGTVYTVLGAATGHNADPLFYQEVWLRSDGSPTAWNPARLRTARYDREAWTFQMADFGAGVFDQTGDAMIVEQETSVNHRVMWLPVPATVDVVTIPELEIPPDHPGAVDLGFKPRGFKLSHDDRFAVEGYAAYVRDGVGLVEPLLLPGERLEVLEAVGRF